ncbi:hypothetical protein G7Y89_g3428 [Cudoniella acicularis]|uniref:SCP domain-containing protein n=1 Tax=Cudoniella acicularis TaxID=354080 RepID=A0A8H4W5Z3_9HELO|nr:hypothetical protein G7Y89_g3428 [Cudoniella acicularis]
MPLLQSQKQARPLSTFLPILPPPPQPFTSVFQPPRSFHRRSRQLHSLNHYKQALRSSPASSSTRSFRIPALSTSAFTAQAPVLPIHSLDLFPRSIYPAQVPPLSSKTFPELHSKHIEPRTLKMRSSIFITAFCAASALAKPIQKKDTVEDLVIITDIVYTTITEGAEAAAPTQAPVVAAAPSHSHHHKHSSAVPSVAPASFTTVVVTQSPVAAAAPATTQASVVVATAEAAAPVNYVSTPVSVPVAATSSAAAVAVPSSSPVDSSLTAYQSAAILHHNKHRANHSAPDVTWDATLASDAATLAATCVFEHDMSIGSGAPYGQNIASITASNLDSMDINSVIASTITNAWYYGEANNWVFGTTASGMDTSAKSWLHFTQVVWVASTTIGCATQKCVAGTMDPTNDSYFTVCNYGPQGNISPEFATNVLPPIGLPAFTAEITYNS